MNIRSIKIFLNWLVEQELITNCPKVKQVPVLEPEVKCLTEMQIAEVGQVIPEKLLSEI